MTRTAIFKFLYFAEVGAVGALLLSVTIHFNYSERVFFPCLLCLLIPGRILGFLWRDLMRGLRLLNVKEYAASKRHSELFLATLAKKPWLRHAIWLGGGTYTAIRR